MVAFERHFARANAWTFEIPPIKKLIDKYCGPDLRETCPGNGEFRWMRWVDPFAGKNSLAEFQNDINPAMPTMYHMEAKDFCEMLANVGKDGSAWNASTPPYKGLLFDPPYSYRQITEHYKAIGIKATALDTSYNFYGRIYEIIAPHIEVGGLALSFGWNSNGVPKKYGFEIIDGIIVAHGLHHQDTIVTVQRKVK